MLTGRLVCDDTGGINQRGRLGPLLSPPLRNTSLLLWFIWYKIKLKLSYLLLHYFFYFITLFKIGWLVPFAIMVWFWWPQNYSKHRWIILELVLQIVGHWKPQTIWICYGQHLQNFQVWSYGLFAYETNSVFTLNFYYRNICYNFRNWKIWKKKDNGYTVHNFRYLYIISSDKYKQVIEHKAFVIYLWRNLLMIPFVFSFDSRTFLTCILFLARGIIAGLFQAAYVYTPEVCYFNFIYQSSHMPCFAKLKFIYLPRFIQHL